MLDAAKVKPSDVSFEYIAFDASVTALGNKAIDAALLVEPYVASVVQKAFAVRMWGASDLIGTMQTLLVNYSPDFIAKRNDVAQRFMIAYLRGVRDYMDAIEQGKDFDAIVAMLAKPTGISDPALFKKMTLIVNDRNGTIDVDSLKLQQKWYADSGYVQKVQALGPVVDTSYVDRALTMLGKQ